MAPCRLSAALRRRQTASFGSPQVNVCQHARTPPPDLAEDPSHVLLDLHQRLGYQFQRLGWKLALNGKDSPVRHHQQQVRQVAKVADVGPLAGTLTGLLGRFASLQDELMLVGRDAPVIVDGDDHVGARRLARACARIGPQKLRGALFGPVIEACARRLSPADLNGGPALPVERRGNLSLPVSRLTLSIRAHLHPRPRRSNPPHRHKPCI